ncbi:MAG: glycosyltransferase [Chthoniobacteraceae bacterium]
MKIALVNNQFQLGGAETVVGQLRSGLVARGHAVELHVAHGKGCPPDVHPLYPRLLIRLYHSRFNGIAEKVAPRFEWMDAAFRRLSKSDADIIHLHNFHGDYATIASLAHVASHKKLVWTFHALWGVTGGCDHPRACLRYLEKCGDCPQVGTWPVGELDGTATQLEEKLALLANKPIHVVAPSEWLAGIVRKSKIGCRWNVHHIANGADLAGFQPRFREPGGVVTVMIVNRNFSDEQKGFGIALEALGRVSGSGIKIILAGQNSGWAASRIPSQFEVMDAGFVKDRAKLAELYAMADIFLFASPAENFPCVILEAMASGCCVVATPSGGVVEQIDHGRSGLLAGEISGQSLALPLQNALASGELRSSLGHAARQSVIQNFPEHRMVDEYLELYRKVIDEN